MRNRSTIQKVLALVLLLIFTFSVTPKKYLHDLVADHTDFYGATHTDSAMVSQLGFNCHCEDLVVSTPFIETSVQLYSNHETSFKAFSAPPYSFHIYTTAATKDSRGPPSVA